MSITQRYVVITRRYWQEWISQMKISDFHCETFIFSWLHQIFFFPLFLLGKGKFLIIRWKNIKYGNGPVAFCLLKLICGGDGLGFRISEISNMAGHTVFLVQKLMGLCTVVYVDRSLLTYQVILAVKCEMRLFWHWNLYPWCLNVSDEFLPWVAYVLSAFHSRM